ncbi:MAG: uridine kinase [Candidatus Eisenbacteria bacterium]|uniref:Uridine kinase n=1 Tax=Eiseniibacteriota bacterium TaxID=2212470 RepID=A0A938BPQ8_UNCEI|nr:uridine kinase [Candidatus Eisenbacteria bacterium]
MTRRERPGEQRRVLIGVAGGSASGKTMVAERVTEQLGSRRIAIIKQDSYYRDISQLPFEERQRQNFDHPDAIDRELLAEQLRVLLQGGAIRMPVYDFKRHLRLTRTIPVSGCRIIIVEGILILDDPVLRALMDIKVYIDTDSDVRLLRRIQRDVTERRRTLESVIEQYQDTVRPMHLQFVEPSKRFADVIIPEGGHNEVAIDLLVTKVRAILASSAEGGA